MEGGRESHGSLGCSMKGIDDFNEDKSLPHPGDPVDRREGREGGKESGAREWGETRKTEGCRDIVSRKHWILKKNNVVDYNVSSDLFIMKSSRLHY